MLGQSIKDGYWNNPRGHKQEPEPQKLNGLGIFSKSEMQDVQKVVDLQSAGTPESEAALQDFLATKDYRFFAEYNLWAALHNQNTGRSDIYGLGWQPTKYVSPADPSDAALAADQPSQHATVVYTTSDLHPWLHPPPDPPDAQLKETSAEPTRGEQRYSTLSPTRDRRDLDVPHILDPIREGLDELAKHELPGYNVVAGAAQYLHYEATNITNLIGWAGSASRGETPEVIEPAKTVPGLFQDTVIEGLIGAFGGGSGPVSNALKFQQGMQETAELIQSQPVGTTIGQVGMAVFTFIPGTTLKVGRAVGGLLSHGPDLNPATTIAKAIQEPGVQQNIEKVSRTQHIISQGTETEPAEVPLAMVDTGMHGETKLVRAVEDPKTARVEVPEGGETKLVDVRAGPPYETAEIIGPLKPAWADFLKAEPHGQRYTIPVLTLDDPAKIAKAEQAGEIKAVADVDIYSTKQASKYAFTSVYEKYSTPEAIPPGLPPKTTERIFESKLHGLSDPAEGEAAKKYVVDPDGTVQEVPKDEAAAAGQEWTPMKPLDLGKPDAGTQGAAGGAARAEALTEPTPDKSTMDEIKDAFKKEAEAKDYGEKTGESVGNLGGLGIGTIRYPPGTAPPTPTPDPGLDLTIIDPGLKDLTNIGTDNGIDTSTSTGTGLDSELGSGLDDLLGSGSGTDTAQKQDNPQKSGEDTTTKQDEETPTTPDTVPCKGLGCVEIPPGTIPIETLIPDESEEEDDPPVTKIRTYPKPSKPVRDPTPEPRRRPFGVPLLPSQPQRKRHRSRKREEKNLVEFFGSAHVGEIVGFRTKGDFVFGKKASRAAAESLFKSRKKGLFGGKRDKKLKF